MTDQQEEGRTLLIPGYRHIQNTRLIIRLEGNGNYTVVHLIGNPKPLMVCQTLKYFEHQLPHFIRASKSSLINPDYVDGVVKQTAKIMHLKLTDGMSIPVSRRRIPDTSAKLGH